MKLQIRHLHLLAFLYTFWFLFSLDFSIENALIGLLICFLVIYLSKNVFLESIKIFDLSLFKMVKYFLFLIYEIYLASFHLIPMIIKKKEEPIIFNLKLDIKDPYIVTLIANSITLTPGTITINKESSLLTVLSIKDDKQNGKLIAEDIKKTFQRFFF
ncbi:Na+/H+ antiporter subunit E [Alkaliphilus transvaalensis]|nr:Na+/H+ antiporter subunit E [Alkaliphilus transvaalensis]